MTASLIQVPVTLKYDDPKQINLDSLPGQGVVYNVLVSSRDEGFGAYVPTVTFMCDIAEDGSGCVGLGGCGVAIETGF